ncbi:MAG: lipopolysaccharide biosynthesis protein [Candidatus Omnitrophota bacterium]
MRQKVAQGFTWVSLGQIISQVIQFVSAIILARLLLPEHFGTITTAYIYIKCIQVLLQGFGLPEALVQNDDTDERHLVTAFSSYLASATVAALITVIVAPFIAGFFHNPPLTAILRVLSVTFVFDSLTSIFEAVISRKLAYKRLVIPQVAGVIVYGVAGGGIAFLTRNVWSLVWALVLKSAVLCLLSWRASEWKPALGFEAGRLKEMLRFGKNVFGAEILNYIGANLDFLIISKFLGVAAMGYYYFAYSVSNYFYYQAAPVFYRVLFPALSRMRDENALFGEFYLKVIQGMALLSVPLHLAVCVNATDVILFLFGGKWLNAADALRILCVNGLLQTLRRGIIRAIFYAKGRPDLTWRWGVFYCLVSCSAILIGRRYGIAGIAAAVTLAELIYFPVIITATNRLIGVSAKIYLRNVWPVIAASTVMVLCLLGMNAVFPVTMGYFLLKMSVAGVIYVLALRISRFPLGEKLKFVYRTACSA